MYGLTKPGTPFMQPDKCFAQLGDSGEMDEEDQVFEIRKINAATAVSMLLRPPDMALQYLQEHFLDAFLGADERLGDWHATLLSALTA